MFNFDIYHGHRLLLKEALQSGDCCLLILQTGCCTSVLLQRYYQADLCRLVLAGSSIYWLSI
jgi:hypothetical protein